jgi:hypothetical protein
MSLTTAAEAARAASVLVRVSGPDADGSARSQASFHSTLDGNVALSVSGSAVCCSEAGLLTVVTPAAPFAAFSSRAARSTWTSVPPGVQVDVLLAAGDTTTWRPAAVVTLLDLAAAVPGLSHALAPLAALHTAGHASAQHPTTAAEHSFTWVAVLSVRMSAQDTSTLGASLTWGSAAQMTAGDALAACGAPFGSLAPAAFAGSVWHATVAQALPWNGDVAHSRQEAPHALLLDMQFMPGMEGAPLAGGASPTGAASCANLAMLLSPLKTTRHAAALCVAVTADTLLSALRARGLLHSASMAPAEASAARNAAPPLEQAYRGVAMLSAVGTPSWGTCVCVGQRARLFLTAAHVIHPSAPAAANAGPASSQAQQHGGSRAFIRDNTAGLPQVPPGAATAAFLRSWHAPAGRSSVLAARTVWVSRGPLDVALVQLEGDASNSDDGALPFTQLEPTARPDTALLPGAPVLVAGHAHFGPGLRSPPPVVTAGCVAAHSPRAGVLRVSAAVHAGASGGAVLCPSTGALLGLVTSNAALSSPSGPGSALSFPSLNFSIAAPALEDLCAACAALPAGIALRPGMPAEAAVARLVAACANLDAPNEHIAAVWALRPGKPHTDVPGPKLAEFLGSLRARL